MIDLTLLTPGDSVGEKDSNIDIERMILTTKQTSVMVVYIYS